ncbi:MAG: P27 family phage terminase small subunit [Oscillospiraceae bacterium]|nr:P27 family phage terminase small subunit [Oscillospiraceae bacterium]
MAKAREVKDSLIKQLQAKGADVTIYRALIDDYMWFYQQLRQMQSDIRKRGRTYTAKSAAGKDYEKNNPSVDDALKYSKQMVTILAALGLSTETVVPPDGIDAEKDSDERDL